MPKPNERKICPFTLLRKAVVFPVEKIPLILQGNEAISAVNEALKGDGQLVLIFQKNAENSPIGTIVKIFQFWQLGPSIIGVTVEGTKRIKILRVFSEKNINKAEFEIIPEEKEEITTELEALSRSVFDQFKRLIQLEGTLPWAVIGEIQKEYVPPEKIGDIVSAAIRIDFPDKIKLLEEPDVKKRLEFLNKKLAEELDIIEAERRIQREVRRKLTKEQKEIILREQMRAIEKELGIYEEEKEYADLEKKIIQAKMPKAVEERALKELHRLRTMTVFSAEAPFIRTYLDWLIELPWSAKSKTKLELKKAKEVLDEDHYGLEKAKERVLEYLAVQKLTKGKGGGTILCFVGPPGTGKTSVGQSIARALDRKFVRISLGGIRDEAEIRGHRRTYVGALPGRIIQGMKNAGVKNPVFMMDEIDKIGADFRGDPSAALLEALDPQQNKAFSDHYIEAPFDLSEVFFITTANILDPIPPALRDRMEVIEFPGYTDEEKFHIAKKFLIPRVLSANGLTVSLLQIEDAAIRKIIHKYTREAGVRNLERELSEIARKVAKRIAEEKAKKKIIVDESNIFDFLGPEKFLITMAEAKDEIGIATGLAWTPVGGDIILIETMIVPGKGTLTLTGQLGDVMQESAKAALSYVRSKSRELNFNPNFYAKSDIHIHVPAGAIPKDGPSAGIAIAAALVSALKKKPIKKEVGLTGEITLTGKVLEIGGVKEKVLAAHRAGVEMVVLPKDNEKNLTDIPEEIRKKLDFRFVKHMDEVLKIALK